MSFFFFQIGGLHIKCARNRYGRQVSSFEGSVRLRGPMLVHQDHNDCARGSGGDHHTTTSCNSTRSTCNSDSTTFLEEHGLDREKCVGVFIRSPVITEVKSPSVTVLAVLDSAPPPDKSSGGVDGGSDSAGGLGGCEVVAVQQDGNILATSFHPELTSDPRWHLYFIDLVCQSKYSTKLETNTDI